MSWGYMTENYMLKYRLWHSDNYNNDSFVCAQPLLVTGLLLTGRTGPDPKENLNCTIGKPQHLKTIGLATQELRIH